MHVLVSLRVFLPVCAPCSVCSWFSLHLHAHFLVFSWKLLSLCVFFFTMYVMWVSLSQLHLLHKDYYFYIFSRQKLLCVYTSPKVVTKYACSKHPAKRQRSRPCGAQKLGHCWSYRSQSDEGEHLPGGDCVHLNWKCARSPQRGLVPDFLFFIQTYFGPTFRILNNSRFIYSFLLLLN